MGKAKLYTAAEMRAVKKRLADQKAKLIDNLAAMLGQPVGFDDACAIRDDAQRLATVAMALETIDQSIAMAEREGKALQLVFRLDECGLEP